MPKSVEKIPRGLDAAWHAAIGRARRLWPWGTIYLGHARKVEELEHHFQRLSDARLKRRVVRLAIPFQLGRDSRADRLLATAAIREVIHRETGMHLFPVQIAGGLALYDGLLVEMATGEGKSITATVPAIMHAWRKKGCHIITVNDYLARRDAEEFQKVFTTAGVSVGYIQQDMTAEQRRTAYNMDITYATNKEVCADYLRDQLQQPLSKFAADFHAMPSTYANSCLKRGLFAAIIDEADSVLIDDAVTPLIISSDAKNPEQVQAYREACDMARNFTEGRDYRLQPRFRSAELTEKGRDILDLYRDSLGGFWNSRRRGEELICRALEARHFYLRDKQYVIQNGKVVIVDESTGRLMPDRYWHNGLHNAVESQESVEIQPIKETQASISFQRFFRLYERLSGMSGTLAEARRELWHIYRRDVMRLPTNRPCIRHSNGIRIHTTEEHKWEAIVKEIHRTYDTGRPVLVGTRSVHASEELSSRLTKLFLPHRVLNARRSAEEAQIIAEAGKVGRITVATNMAGRGTDIRLEPQSRETGGLYVIATELHESGRVDRQLAGRAGRQGDPGDNIVFASLDDQLFSTHAPAMARLITRTTRGNKAIPYWTAELLTFRAQIRSQRLAVTQRMSVAYEDEQLDESLGFAGVGLSKSNRVA